ncbi:hypothetical protein [Stieleria tagensis]|uniref:hypothetical protein n=1 Tax=Stieleria tagensis TaxID=2956795 RepID=UPI00209ADF2B|nr:hypothetical protein [Stieleria tagensis]
MLSLFTVLVVSFVVFSSQVADSSAASQERRLSEILPKPPIDSAVLQLVTGTSDSRSAAFGASLMEDFYGVDGRLMRVGHRRANPNTKAAPNGGRGSLLLPLDALGKPQSTLFRFPTNMAFWHADGAVADLSAPLTGLTPLTEFASLLPYLDDTLAGRIVTFARGPLRNRSFRLIRSFGITNGTTDAGLTATQPSEYAIAGSFVIDLSEMGDEFVEIDGVPEPLYLVAATTPNRLLYDVGPDGAPGRAGVSDDGIGGVDDDEELGWPGSDDIGFPFVLNGAVFNGLGVNPSGRTGVTHTAGGTAPDTLAEIEFTLNSRLTGSAYQGGNQLPEFDESWDAPDWENIFLAWQPSDHRRAVNSNIYAGVNGVRLNQQLGQHIIPSFHRPAIINYLMNAPIRIPGDQLDPTSTLPAPAAQYTERTFSDIKIAALAGTELPDDITRLRFLVTRIRRATVRPLNFPHEYGTAATSDLDQDGDPYDGAPFFSGSNQVPILNQTIDISANLATIVLQVEELAHWLINGPWDVDNDGDGLPDSVWVDLNLPVVNGPNGKLLKPMVAPLIEDLDGKINVNFSGNYNQLINQQYTVGPINYGTNPAQYLNANTALGSFGFGGGVGPAEIDFSHLFAFESSPRPGFVGPLPTAQTDNVRQIDEILLTRYGNLMNTRYGGAVYNYASSYPYVATSPIFRIPSTGPPANFPQNIYPYTIPYANPLPAAVRPTRFLTYPGAGNRLQPAETADSLARIPFPSRSIDHTPGSFAGRPVDISGTERVVKDQYGSHRINSPLRSADVVNHPYEFGATEIRGDDAPFSAAEYVDLVSGGPLAGRLAQLLGDAADRNEALARIITTDSRSVDSPEMPGFNSALHLFARRFADEPSADPAVGIQSTLLSRMLAVELRKGSKLNLNRQLGNIQDDNTNGLGDETLEVRSVLRQTGGTPAAFERNAANNRRSLESAFPEVAGRFPAGATNAHYGPTSLYVAPGMPATDAIPDFDGIDLNGDGDLNDFGIGEGTDIDGDGEADAIASGSELLARHLYCLMFALITGDIDASGELVPSYPYPAGLRDASVTVDTRNRYVARQIAQWAANAVDYRDTDAKFTRLRYDPNPFDSDGFSLAVAAANEVWGMERPELQITETFAMHDKRMKRNLIKQLDPGDPSLSLDGQLVRDDDTDTAAVESDSDMDQFRIPQGSAFIELQALAPPIDLANAGASQPSLPRELYTANNELDLERIVGTGNAASPVWRIAVGQYHSGDHNKSSRWVFDADRLVDLSDPGTGPDSADYLNATIDWTAGDQTAARNQWNFGMRHGADVRGLRLDTNADGIVEEYVVLGDDDFNPTNDATNDTLVRLERFVWFAPLPPSPTLNVIDPTPATGLAIPNNSGMRPDNVYFNKPDQTAAANPVLNVPARLLPGQFAVVAPRITTHFGQKSTSARDAGPGAAAGPDSFPYEPSEQRIELAQQTVPGIRFKLNYYNNDTVATNPRIPRYEDDDPAAYRVNHVLPIVCQSLYPNEIAGYVADPMAWDWVDYAGVANDQKVDMGFNISEPLPGDQYYRAPQYRIQDGSRVAEYPLVDGYRDYANATSPQDPAGGLHDDVPFDHRVTAPLTRSTTATGDLAAIGTHQEAATIFVQRLADPTVPWHPKNNPYVTIDFMPMDLTTFNGEEDVREQVVRQVVMGGAPVPVTEELDDVKTDWNTPAAGTENGFTPMVRLDSRRKIPDLTKDRGLSTVIPGQTVREMAAHRTALTMTTSVLRETTPTRAGIPTGPIATEPYWAFELGAMWDENKAELDAVLLNTAYASPIPGGNAASIPVQGNDASSVLSLDIKTRPFRQSLGFVNREFGVPTSSDSLRVGTFGIGSPEYVVMLSIPWMNREYQSPMDLMNVPAVSRTRLLATFNPSSVIENNALREVPLDVWESFEDLRGSGSGIQSSHLLRFDAKQTSYRTEDGDGQYGVNNRQRLGISENVTSNFESLTGGTPGFEQIFDFVDVGPVWFDSQRWLDPSTVQFQQDQGVGPGINQRRDIFNRVVETLQPPNNFVGKHRTPGKINLNTMPDYIRKGASFSFNQNEFLDGPNTLENSETPDTGPSPTGQTIGFRPQNDSVRGDGVTTQYGQSQLFGNGSVFRSFASKHSTAYELDTDWQSPTTLGSPNWYDQFVDTPFGMGFKAFIESRRGYHATVPASTTNPNGFFGGNPTLDYRYPTRFAGVFGPAQGSQTPSIQRFMRVLDRSQSTQPSSAPSNLPRGVPRRTRDMSILRPHPDFDLRLMDDTQRTSVQAQAGTTFSVRPENNQTGILTSPAPPTMPSTAVSTELEGLVVPMVNTGLFERPQAELHRNRRNLDRDSYFKYRDAGRLANMTTNHSNVFMLRLTLGYFEVDATTGAVGAEHISDTGEPERNRATFIIDRTIPIGFMRGMNMNTEETILYSEVEE